MLKREHGRYNKLLSKGNHFTNVRHSPTLLMYSQKTFHYFYLKVTEKLTFFVAMTQHANSCVKF